MRRAALPLLAAGLLALAACSESATSDQGDLYGDVTAPASPGTQPNAPQGQIPPPQPAPEGGDVMGARPGPGTDPVLPSTPPTLPQDPAQPAPPVGPQ
ncbi:MAG: hypothetical protein ACOY5Y_06625 [Pseudomonadota bacterium]|jgi:hypothetical protein